MRVNWPIVVGTLGMLCTAWAALIHASVAQSALFLSGAVLMTYSAYAEKHRFFFVLQIIVIVGVILGFFALSVFTKIVILLPITLGLIGKLRQLGAFQSRNNYLGLAGMVLLAVGYAVLHPAIYLCGGFTLTVFATTDYLRGTRIALLWAILNAVFVITASIGLYQLLTHH